jgi:hypothetical protein
MPVIFFNIPGMDAGKKKPGKDRVFSPYLVDVYICLFVLGAKFLTLKNQRH